MEMFCPDTPFMTIYGLVWSTSVTFKQKDDAGALQCVTGYATSLYLVMITRNNSNLVKYKTG